MIPDHANPAKLPPPIGPPMRLVRSCDLHSNCEIADADAARRGWAIIHCREFAPRMLKR